MTDNISSFDREVNRLTSRHIARTLTALQDKYDLEEGLIEGIKSGFRHLQDDILNNTGKVQHEGKEI